LLTDAEAERTRLQALMDDRETHINQLSTSQRHERHRQNELETMLSATKSEATSAHEQLNQRDHHIQRLKTELERIHIEYTKLEEAAQIAEGKHRAAATDLQNMVRASQHANGQLSMSQTDLKKHALVT
jgi:chromosome segregation ATPase